MVGEEVDIDKEVDSTQPRREEGGKMLEKLDWIRRSASRWR